MSPAFLALFLLLGVLSGKTAADILPVNPPTAEASTPATLSVPQPQGVSQVITWDGSNGIAINPLVGADRFYNVGVWGQGTVVANVEAGHVWNGHEITGQVQNFYTPADALGEADIHATWVGSLIAGYAPAITGPYPYSMLGMAPLTELHSGAIATAWNGDSSFSITPSTFYNAYTHFFTTSVSRTIPVWFGSMEISAPADVINSSWGYTDPTGSDAYTMAADGLARAHPQTALVVSAGNSGSAPNSVGGPASGYNTIAVGAAGDYSFNNFTSVADFSSRGPQDYYDPIHGLVKGVRAPVSLVAPGTSLWAAYYGGKTGSNSPALSALPLNTSTNLYNYGLAGTSFAAPIVSGGISLLKSASYIGGMGDAARDTRVI